MKKILFTIVLVLSAGSLLAQMKIGHVNTQVVWDTIPSAKLALLNYSEFEKKAYKELLEMQDYFQTSVAKYKSDRPNMSPVLIKIEEQKLMEQEQAIEERQQSLQNEMQAYSSELNEPIQELILKAIQNVAELEKLNYAIDVSAVLYSAGGIDITNQVIDELLKIDR